MIAGMETVSAQHVTKSFGNTQVVRDVSFTVRRGEVFGLVGPNGAGKTTTIRILLDIIKADTGAVLLFGQPSEDADKGRIGYLPEERGLYRNMKAWDILKYLSELKGVSWAAAEPVAERILVRAGLYEHRMKKVSELSRGMSQIIQFAATLAHDPELVVLDEPFSGLDPVNTELLKELVRELRSKGKTIIFSTHQMNQIEELCDRVLMINEGQVVLYGTLSEVKSQFASNALRITWSGEPPDFEGMQVVSRAGNTAELALDGGSPQRVLENLLKSGSAIERFEVATPSLHEIFITVVERMRSGR